MRVVTDPPIPDEPPFSILEIPDDAPEQREEAGTKTRFWFTHRDGEVERRGVFKRRRRPDSGNDWAERIACELARLLGLPAAEYDLAAYAGELGVVSWSFVRFHRASPGADLVAEEGLVLGNEVLARRHEGYPRSAVPKEDRRVKGHTLSRVLAAAAEVAPPDGGRLPLSVKDGADALVGYLLLDAWIANTDRHHRNWGWIEERVAGRRRLAPAFDQDASLGHELNDAKRQKILAARGAAGGIAAYVERGESELWTDDPDPTRIAPIEAFRRAATVRPAAAADWLRRLDAVADEQVAAIVRRVPASRMSEAASLFCRTLLRETRRRLLGSARHQP